jgi:hypothetical protein
MGTRLFTNDLDQEHKKSEYVRLGGKQGGDYLCTNT